MRDCPVSRLETPYRVRLRPRPASRLGLQERKGLPSVRDSGSNAAKGPNTARSMSAAPTAVAFLTALHLFPEQPCGCAHRGAEPQETNRPHLRERDRYSGCRIQGVQSRQKRNWDGASAPQAGAATAWRGPDRTASTPAAQNRPPSGPKMPNHARSAPRSISRLALWSQRDAERA